MLKFAHLGVVLAVLLAFWQAPFQHRHDSDSHHEHSHGQAHVHLSDHDHEVDGPILQKANHGSDVQLIDWLAGDGVKVVKVVPSLPEQVLTVRVSSYVIAVDIAVQHNHDPPERSPSQPRAPPV